MQCFKKIKSITHRNTDSQQNYIVISISKKTFHEIYLIKANKPLRIVSYTINSNLTHKLLWPTRHLLHNRVVPTCPPFIPWFVINVLGQNKMYLWLSWTQSINVLHIIEFNEDIMHLVIYLFNFWYRCIVINMIFLAIQFEKRSKYHI